MNDWVRASDVISAIESGWHEQCSGNRNEDACESCRAYADAVRSVEWVYNRGRALTKPPDGPIR